MVKGMFSPNALLKQKSDFFPFALCLNFVALQYLSIYIIVCPCVIMEKVKRLKLKLLQGGMRGF